MKAILIIVIWIVALFFSVRYSEMGRTNYEKGKALFSRVG